MNNKKCKTFTSVADLIKPKKNYLYECHCIRCDGKKVDPRTQERHAKDECLWKSKNDKKKQEIAIMSRKKSTNKLSDVNLLKTNSNKSKKRKRDVPDSFQSNKPNNEDIPPNFFSDSFQLNNEENIHTLFSPNFRIPTLDNGDNYLDEENNQYYIYQEEEEDNNSNIDQEEENDNDSIGQEKDDSIDQEEENDEDNIEQEENDDDDNIKNLFTYPEIDSDEIFVMENLNDSMETEIILWVFKFQQRFRLSDLALEALIKFLHIILTHLNKLQFKNFPKSLYIAKKMLNIFQPKMQLAACNKYHKLHNVKNIVEYKKEGKAAIANCLHEEFPNNPCYMFCPGLGKILLSNSLLNLAIWMISHMMKVLQMMD
ncbi:hypothetical protein RhiirB3_392871 [Rhizophagus irregularis]|nr:hypothetical protein RhiirB3_392871 [Rhizophagus irregularis]